ncbi:MAG: hypothetical protein V1809_08820 [Planctomycetota bacterium]
MNGQQKQKNATGIREPQRICPFCHKRRGEISITDGDTGEELLICEPCDLDLFDAGTLRRKLEKEIAIQIKHHREERNIPAENSLKYILEVMRT